MSATNCGTAPLASIIICSYNYERFLAEAINSALNQTYPHVEVIAVDDGSTDGSREIIAAYRGRVIPFPKDNEGHDAAINSGLRVSSGEVVCFLDSDDALFPTAIEGAVEAMRDTDVVKVHWPLCIVDEHGRNTGKLLPGDWLPEGDLSDIVIRRGPQSYPSPPTSGNAWARRFLEKVCPLATMENRAGTADDQLSMLAPLFGLVQTLKPQAFFRAHGGNNYWGRSLDHLAMTLRDYDRCCRVLSEACRKMGLPADEDAWKRDSWFYRLNTSLQEVVDIVPPGETIILVDDDKWGTAGWFAGRRCLPLPERDGVYWGKPADDVEAIRELERLRKTGATFLVIGWPAFWWRQYYPGWDAYLNSAFRCALKNDRLVVFDLRSSAEVKKD